MNSEDNHADFYSYDLDPDKSVDYVEDAIFQRNEKISVSCDYKL